MGTGGSALVAKTIGEIVNSIFITKQWIIRSGNKIYKFYRQI